MKITLPWEVEEGVELNITATFTISRYRPATGPTMEHAGGDPEEGGEMEDLEFTDFHGGPLDQAVIDRLIKDEALADKLRELAAEQDSGPDGDDINDERRDRESDPI